METKKGLTGNGLKLIAILTMFIDHFAYIILERGYMMHPSGFGQLNALYNVDTVMRGVGRLAFIIFLFLLVEGFQHTSSVVKYGLRLLIFAVISEVPFNIATNGTLLNPDYQSVYFTLFLSLVMMFLFETISDKFLKEKKWLCVLLCLLVFVCISVIAHIIKCDYTTLGIAMAAVMYLFRNKPSLRPWVMLLVITAYCLIPNILALLGVSETICSLFGGSSILEIVGVFAFLIMIKYNGERGSFNLKYIFYLFYPIHLLILGLIEVFMFEGGILLIK